MIWKQKENVQKGLGWSKSRTVLGCSLLSGCVCISLSFFSAHDHSWAVSPHYHSWSRPQLPFCTVHGWRSWSPSPPNLSLLRHQISQAHLQKPSSNRPVSCWTVQSWLSWVCPYVGRQFPRKLGDCVVNQVPSSSINSITINYIVEFSFRNYHQ